MLRRQLPSVRGSTPRISTSRLFLNVRPRDPCPDLNDRRAAPPLLRAPSALPLPCGPRRYRQHRMTTIAVMDEAAMNYPVAEVRNGNAQRQLLHGAPRLHDEVAAATSAKPRT